MRRCTHALVACLVAWVVATATVVLAGSPASAAGGFHGNVEAVASYAPGQVHVAGWMFDEDAPATSISYHVYVGGTGPGDPSSYGIDLGLAQLQRDDVAAAYPGAGPYHGFGATFAVPMHGTQPVYIFAINAGGTPGGNALLWSGSVFIANPPPETTITARPPASSTNRTASFAFSANEPSTFSCRWDQGGWQPCSSPAGATLAVGSHTFAVQAVDADGAADPTPATYYFTVTSPPPPPAPTTPTPTTPPPETAPTPPAPPRIALLVSAVRKKSRLRVDIGPDLNPSNYRFTVQERKGRKWRTVRRTQTLGPQDLMVIDLPRGTYRVVVPRQHDMPGAEATVRLRR